MTGSTPRTVLDTAWDDARDFLACWRAWQTPTPNQAQSHRMLHYVGILSPEQARALPAALADLAASADSTMAPLARELAARCWGLLPGFARLLLAQGQVSLTLCVGPLAPMLAELQMQADAVLLHPDARTWDLWRLKALAKVCGPGARLCWRGRPQPSAALAARLHAAGFQLDLSDAALGWRFAPPWPAHRRRHPAPLAAPAPGHCVVLGAGLGGAGVAHALALRGWQVTVLDAHAEPAAGASGLPAGLLVPHVSADDSPRSRLSRSGTRLMLSAASEALRTGQDWAPSGVLELRPPGRTDHTPHGWEQPGATRLADQPWAGGVPQPGRSLWHPHAGWIKPARMVRAWLSHPCIRYCGNSPVASLVRRGARWSLRDAQGQELLQTDLLVLCNAAGSVALLQGLAQDSTLLPAALAQASGLGQVHGSVHHQRIPAGPPALPPFPVNGNGSFLPTGADDAGAHWYMGATYEADARALQDKQHQRDANFAKLQGLLPQLANGLGDDFRSGAVGAWQGTRCIARDRLPLVGPLQEGPAPSLWICTGFGSRGLSFAALCAQVLVARIGAEPLPVEKSLLRSLEAARQRRRGAAGITEPNAAPPPTAAQ